MKSDTAELSEDRYKELVRAEAWLRCLESAGVDNWEGISFAYELAEAEGVSDEE